MLKKEIKNIFSVSLGTVLNSVLGVITVPVITRLVDPAAYGKFGFLQTYMSVFAAICLLGLDQAYVRFYYDDTSVEYKRELTHKIVFIPVLLSLICFGLFFFGGSLIVEADKLTFILLGICIFSTVIETFTKLCLRLEQQGSVYSFFLVLHRITYAATVIGLVYFGNIDSVKALLIGTGFSLFLNAAVTVITKREIWGIKKCGKNKVRTKELVKYAYPFVFSSIAGWLFNAAGKLSLQHFSTYEEIGFYSAANEIVSIIMIINTTFTTLWVPMAVENFEKNPDNRTFYKESNNLITVIMVVASLTIVLFKDVFGFILGSEYTAASQIFPCLVLQPAMFAISETTVYGINFYKKTKWHVVITVICCAANVAGNYILVPIFGGKGAAMSTGFSYILFFIVRTICSNRYFKVDFEYKKLAFSIIIIVAFFLYQTFTQTSIMSFVLYMIFMVVFIGLYFETVKKYISILLSSLKNKRISND